MKIKFQKINLSIFILIPTIVYHKYVNIYAEEEYDIDIRFLRYILTFTYFRKAKNKN